MKNGARTEAPLRVAISASECPDIAAFGLSAGHLRDIVADLALQCLAADMDLVYGGDLRKNGLTRLLFELVMRYTRSQEAGQRARVMNHLAWPVHIGMSIEDIESLASELRGVAQLVLIGDDGTRMTLRARRAFPPRTPSAEEWMEGLAVMRNFQGARTDARVVLGGQVAGYKGRMPGVAEEALLSLRCGQPLYLIGGFGGAARDVAESLGLAERWAGSRHIWQGQEEFSDWSGHDLNNGLSQEENHTLATTSFIGQAIVLVLRGLYRTRTAGDRNGRGIAHA